MSTPIPTILYIFGFLEDDTHPLYQKLKSNIPEYHFHHITLYPNQSFGSYSFTKELGRISRVIDTIQPTLIIGHSLGAYISLLLQDAHRKILLDPSLPVSEIFLSNTQTVSGKYVYDDGITRLELSAQFIASIKKPSVTKIKPQKSLSVGYVDILGAGKGGYRIAERYAKALPQSHYMYLRNATHNFDSENDTKIITQLIKKRLRNQSQKVSNLTL